jgi:hypothetical protein
MQMPNPFPRCGDTDAERRREKKKRQEDFMLYPVKTERLRWGPGFLVPVFD